MKRKIPLLLLSLFFFGMAAYSGYQMLVIYRDYKAGEDAYDSLTQYIHPADTSLSDRKQTDTVRDSSDSIEEDTHTVPTVDFESLKAINSDVVAWIYLPGTAINYPVMQGVSNDEYLYSLLDKTYNRAGSIFMDYRNQPDFTDRHTVLYGHHMKNNTMFSPIVNYKDQPFYDEHPSCYIITPEGNYTLEFFAGFVSDTDSNAWKLEFGSDDEYGAWLKEAAANSTFKSNISPTPYDHIVTLSTCSYEYDDARYVLLGIFTSQG